jgi:hypothetical protein
MDENNNGDNFDVCSSTVFSLAASRVRHQLITPCDFCHDVPLQLPNDCSVGMHTSSMERAFNTTLSACSARWQVVVCQLAWSLGTYFVVRESVGSAWPWCQWPAATLSFLLDYVLLSHVTFHLADGLRPVAVLCCTSWRALATVLLGWVAARFLVELDRPVAFTSVGSLRARRILVLGAPCSGKTQISQALAEALSLPLVSTDTLRWQGHVKGGSERPTFIDELHQTCCTPNSSWILEGNWRRIQTDIGPQLRVDLILVLSTPRLLVYGRLLCRDIYRWCSTRDWSSSSDFWWLLRQPFLHPPLDSQLEQQWGAPMVHWF